VSNLLLAGRPSQCRASEIVIKDLNKPCWRIAQDYCLEAPVLTLWREKSPPRGDPDFSRKRRKSNGNNMTDSKDSRMHGGHDGGDEYASLEEQMKNLLKKIERETVPDELQDLARELNAALQRRRKSSDSQE
jgi:hypothetical protein